MVLAGAMMRRLPILFLFLAGSVLFADVPLRDCTLTAPASAVQLPANQLAPYQQGNQLVLKTRGLLFPGDTNKNIEAAPTGDNSTPYRTAINYHRSLHNDDAAKIASYWHPAMRPGKLQQLNQPGVMEQTKQTFGALSHVELLGMLDINNRQVVFVRYDGKTRAYITVALDGVYYLVSDPGIAPQIAIACAAFDAGKAQMAQP